MRFTTTDKTRHTADYTTRTVQLRFSNKTELSLLKFSKIVR